MSSLYLAEYLQPPTVEGPVYVEVVAPGLVPVFPDLAVEPINLITINLSPMLTIDVVYIYMETIGLSQFPPLPIPVVPIDEIPEYPAQTPQVMNPETPVPAHGVDPVPTERWYEDRQYRRRDTEEEGD